MARKRDYEDGDFDPPKRSSPYQNISDDEYDMHPSSKIRFCDPE